MAHVQTLSPNALNYLNEVKELPAAAVIAVEFAVCVSKWAARRRSRRALRQLTVWQLDDVGLTPRQARNEAAKVFWRA